MSSTDIATTRSLWACSNTRASNRSSDIVERIAASVRSSLENTRSGEAVETGNVAKTLIYKVKLQLNVCSITDPCLGWGGMAPLAPLDPPVHRRRNPHRSRSNLIKGERVVTSPVLETSVGFRS